MRLLYSVLVVMGLMTAVAPAYAAPAKEFPEYLLVQDNTGKTVRFLGFVARGPQTDVQRLQNEATDYPFSVEFVPPPEGPKLTVIFKHHADPVKAQALYDRATSPSYSTLKIGLILAPNE